MTDKIWHNHKWPEGVPDAIRGYDKPLFYLVVGILIYKLLGWIYTISFAALIIPLSYFTIFYFEWLYDAGLGIPISSKWLNSIRLRRISKNLNGLRSQINKQMDSLSSRLRME